MRRAVLAGAALVLASSPVHAEGCPASTVDIGNWAIVRSARVPGFTLRLPRTFTRDSASLTDGSAPTARWSDAARARFTMSHRAASATPAPLPVAEGRASYTRCEDRVGTATATIVAYGDGTDSFVLHAYVRWPDGEALDVHANATDRARLEELLAAVRTIRRAGA